MFALGLFQRVRRMGTQLVPATQGSAACPRGTRRATRICCISCLSGQVMRQSKSGQKRRLCPMDQTRSPDPGCFQKRAEKRSADLLGLTVPCAAGAQLEAGGENEGGVQPWRHISLATHDITAKLQALTPAAALTNTESFPFLPPSICLPWKEQSTLKLLQLVAPPGAGGSPAKLQARLHPHRGEEEQRHDVCDSASRRGAAAPTWLAQGGGQQGWGVPGSPCPVSRASRRVTSWERVGEHSWGCAATVS